MTPDSLISENLTLLSMPEIVLKLNSMLENPDCTASEIGNEISLDPGLTVRVLKVVNSALFGLPKQVKNIPTAITLLGFKQLRDIVMTTSVIKKFQSIPADLVNMNTYWQHSLSCAISARVIASHCQLKEPEDFFVMGLLHDIGKLVMYLVLPDQSREVLREIRLLQEQSNDADVTGVEKKIFGFNHATLGRVLTQQWNLPESQTTPIAEHHLKFSQLTMVESSTVLKLADYISNQLQPAISPDDVQVLESESLTVLDIDDAMLDILQEQTMAIVKDTMSLVYSN